MEQFKETSFRYKKFIIDTENFKVVKELNSGGFGSVCSVKNIETGELCAAKVLDTHKDPKQYKRMISREIGIMVRCQHPTIIRFIGYSLHDFDAKNNVMIFMELAKKGSLAELLQNVQKGLVDGFYNNTTRQIILVGIARGMMFLHQHKIIHRDLKPGNILLDENFHPLITDFGLSKMNDNSNSITQSQSCGTSMYMAPEVIEGDRYNGKADVYAFGILMYEVVTDSTPYPLLANGKLSSFQFNKKIVDEDFRPDFSFPVKKMIKKLIQRCWARDPHERPTFEEIFKKLAYNIEDSIEDIYDYQDTEDTESKINEEDDNSYYLDNVDIDEVITYADDIARENSSSDSELASKLEKLLKPIKEENEKMKSIIESFKEENEQLKKELNEKINKVSEKNKDEEEDQNELEERLARSIKRISSDVDEKTEEIRKDFNELIINLKQALNNDITNVKEDNERLNDNITDVKTHIKEINDYLKNVKEDNERFNDDITNVKKDNERLNKKIEEILQFMKDIKKENDSFKMANEKLTKENDSMKKRISLLEEKLENKILVAQKEPKSPSEGPKSEVSNNSSQNQPPPPSKATTSQSKPTTTTTTASQSDNLPKSTSTSSNQTQLTTSQSEKSSNQTSNLPSESAKETKHEHENSKKSKSSHKLSEVNEVSESNESKPKDDTEANEKNTFLKSGRKLFSRRKSKKFDTLPPMEPIDLDTLTITDFNNLPLQYQQNIIAEIITKTSDSKLKSFFSNINGFLLYLIPYNQDPKNPCFELAKRSQNELLKNITIDQQIKLVGKGTDALIRSDTFNWPEFTNHLTKFKDTSIEINYPSPRFKAAYETVTYFKDQQKDKVKIEIFITKNDLKFKANEIISTVKFDNSVEEIEGDRKTGGSFQDCTSLRNVFISNSITKIGECVFLGCKHLSYVFFEENSIVSSIGYQSFAACNSLRRITLPPSLKKIGSHAFIQCESLTEINIPESVQVIKSHAFYQCKNLQNVTLPPILQIIGEYAFYECVSLMNISIPTSVITLGEYAFFGCTKLKEATISTGLTSLGDSTFKGCSSLEQISIPANIKKIGNHCFNGCTSLKQVTLSPSISSISEGTFQNCTSLEQITIPSSVTIIEASAFYKCSALKQVSFPSYLKTIAAGAFSECTSLELVLLPKSAKSVAASAFPNSTKVIKKK